jgi:hypothetical protein
VTPRAVGYPGERDALGLLLAGELFHHLAGLKVDDVQGVVRQVSNEQPIPFVIDGQMVEPTRLAGERNGLNQFERFRVVGVRRPSRNL